MRNQLFAVLLAVAACGHDGAGVGSGSGSGSGSDQSSVTVLDPGAEPRTLLAYQIAPHSKESFTTTIALAATMDGKKTMIPTMQMDGVVVFADPGKDGLAFTFTSSHLAYQDTPGALVPAAKLNPPLQGVTLTVTGTLAPSGRISDLAMSASDNAPEALKKTLGELENAYSQMVAELPNVPVGRGARWQRVIKISDNGVDAEQTMDFTLVDVQGSRVALKTAIAMEGKPQQIGQAELKKFTGHGTYDATIDLTRMIGATVMNVHVEQEAAAMGQTVSYAFDTTTTTAPETDAAPR